MKRREFITLLAGAAAAWPVATRAQQAIPVLGFLGSASPSRFADRMQAFQNGLKETGYVEGYNVAIEYRWANDRNDLLPTMAADLVRRQVTVIATAGGTPSALAAKAATSTIPIVFHLGTDPVAVGLVDRLNRPGGNLTGITTLGVELGAKRLELIHELAPRASTIALLLNPTNTAGTQISSQGLQAAAGTLGLNIHPVYARNEREMDAAFESLVRLRAGALVISTDPLFNIESARLGSLAARHAIPAIHGAREFADTGGVMSYGTSLTDSSRQAGIYTGRVLKGEKPADLPVMQAAKVELIVNLKAAKTLGLAVPTALLVRADEVIE